MTLRTELTRYQEEALERENEAEAARQAEQLVSGNDSTSRVSDSSFAEGIRNGDKDKGDMSNNQVPTMAPGEGVQTEEPRPVTPLPSTDLRPSTPSLVIISVPNSALVRRTEYPLKVSKSLYEDIASTRRELARYSNTNTTAVPHSSSSSIAGNRRFGDYVDRPVQNYNTAESSESESALLHAIARGDFFESKGPGSTSSTSTGHRSYSDSYRPSSSYSGSSPVPVSRPATRSPPPKQLMSYYSHLLHPSDSRTAISSDSPINRRAGRRREYLARLHEAE